MRYRILRGPSILLLVPLVVCTLQPLLHTPSTSLPMAHLLLDLVTFGILRWVLLSSQIFFGLRFCHPLTPLLLLNPAWSHFVFDLPRHFWGPLSPAALYESPLPEQLHEHHL